MGFERQDGERRKVSKHGRKSYPKEKKEARYDGEEKRSRAVRVEGRDGSSKEQR